MEELYKVIFIIGPPGVGKNTQCDKIVEKYNFIHLGAGDLLRQEIKKGTENGKLIESLMTQGKYVPVKITCGLLKKAMDSLGKNKIFLIDGYPRNQDNIDGWKEIFGNNYKLIVTIILKCNEEELEKRLLERAKSSGRVDDNIETIKKRFKTHIVQSLPIEAQLKEMGPVLEVQGNGSIEEVFKKISINLPDIIFKGKKYSINFIKFNRFIF